MSERRFLVNFWSGNHVVNVKDEAGLRDLAESLARERDTTVTYAEVIDGKAVVLGAIPRPYNGAMPPAAKVRSKAEPPPAPERPDRPRAPQVQLKVEPPAPPLVVSPVPLPVPPKPAPGPAETVLEALERISLVDD